MSIFGVDWVGVNPENSRKLLLSIAFVIAIVLGGAVLRWIVGLVLSRADHATT